MPNKPGEDPVLPDASVRDNQAKESPSDSDAELQRVLDFFKKAPIGEATTIDHKVVGGDGKKVRGVSLQMLNRSYDNLPQLEPKAENAFRKITDAIVEGLRQNNSVIIDEETYGTLMVLAEEKGLKSSVELVAAFLLKPVAAVPHHHGDWLILILTQQQIEEHMRHLGLNKLDVLLPTTDIKH